MVHSIDSLSGDNSKEFWAQIHKLGLRVQANVPLQIRDGSNFIVEENKVLKRWEHDFYDLLNPQRWDSTYDDELLQNSKRVRNDIENYMRENNYQCNAALDKEVDEVEKVISKLKNDSSVGNDQIPNEVTQCTHLNTFYSTHHGPAPHICVAIFNAYLPSVPYRRRWFQCLFPQRLVYGALQTARSSPVPQIVVARLHLLFPQRRIYVAPR